MRVGLLLQLRDGSGFRAAVRAMATQLPEDRAYLDRDALAASYGPAPAALEAIATFATNHALQVTAIDRASGLVVLEGPVDRCIQALHVKPDFCPGTIQTTAPPPELREIVDAVFGFASTPAATVPAAAPAVGRSLPTHPGDVMRRYRFPAATTGRGQTIAILLLGGGFYDEDLQEFFGDRWAGRLDVVEVGAGCNDPAPRSELWRFFEQTEAGQPPSANPELLRKIRWTIEAAVDIELAGSFAPGADLAVYFATSDEVGKLEGVAAALAGREQRPSVLSCSWGASEADVSPEFANGLDRLFQTAALTGTSVCYSSGNRGANVRDGRPTVNFPASSPHVLACGGTALRPGEPEVAWSQVFWGLPLATGGGFSRLFTRPEWQRGVPESPDGEARRGVPDVAAKADFDSGYEIVLAGRRVRLGGGTSAAVPLWAGLLARMSEALETPVGWLTPLLYRPELAGCLSDVVVGSNGFYDAESGWDAITGWGTPNGERLLTALRRTSATRD